MEQNRIKNFSNLITVNTKQPTQEQINKRLTTIRMKLKAGRRLSASDMAFLQKYSYELYQTAQRVEMEREQLEHRLHSAKTKEEAQTIINTAFSEISSKDPDAEYKIAALMNVIKNYKNQEDYKNLPENEKSKHQGNQDNSDALTGIYGNQGEFIPLKDNECLLQ